MITEKRFKVLQKGEFRETVPCADDHKPSHLRPTRGVTNAIRNKRYRLILLLESAKFEFFKTSLHMRLPILTLGIICCCHAFLPAQDQHHPYRPGIDVIHYDFTIDLPDTGTIIRGDATVLFRRTATVDHLTLDLLSLNVSRATLNGKDVRFARDSATIVIPLPPLPSFHQPDTFTVNIRYVGPVTDGLIIRNEEGSWTAFGDNWPNRARNWLPTVDHPSDKATVTWNVLGPANRTIVANGELIEQVPLSSASPSRIRTVWACHRPIPTYVMVIAAGPLTGKDLGLSASGASEFPGGVRQSLYTLPDQSPEAMSVFDSAVSIVNYFSQVVGPFPYEKLAHCQSLTIFGGMENASAIFYSDRGFRRKEITDELIAHETAHQWFGDAVTPNTWANLWLSEGFATYFAELWREHSQGDSSFRRSMDEMRNGLLHSKKTFERPVLDTVETNVLALLNSNSYQKGAWVLHMLRSLLGDEVFFRGIRMYYSDFKHQNAVTDDLQNVMERVSGRPLSWFFDEWLRRPGYVTAEIKWTFEAQSKSVRLTIIQRGQFPPFRFPLAVDLKQGNKTLTSTIDIPAEPVSVMDLPWQFDRPPSEVLADQPVAVLGIIHVIQP